MNHWLFKSEPNAWGWNDQLAKGDAGEEWDGIRNYQARNNMRLMEIGDLGFLVSPADPNYSTIQKKLIAVVRYIDKDGVVQDWESSQYYA